VRDGGLAGPRCVRIVQASPTKAEIRQRDAQPSLCRAGRCPARLELEDNPELLFEQVRPGRAGPLALGHPGEFWARLSVRFWGFFHRA
jgi:hypothetical protein